MTSSEAMDKAAANLKSALPPLDARWAENLMRMAYEAGRRDAEIERSDSAGGEA